MLRFFRKIRRSLLTDNKFSKYFLYAVGEIMLVVIGILIALQIDNWNEGRKARQSEKQLLVSLSEDFKYNLVSLETSLDEIPRIIEEYSLVVEHAGDVKNGLSEKIKADILNTGFIRTVLVDGTLSSVLGSSTLDLIRNDSLKRLLTSYPARLKNYKESENDLIEYVIGVQRPLFRSYVSLSDFLLDEPRFDKYKAVAPESDYEGLLRNREYLNSVIGIRSFNTSLLNRCRELHGYTLDISRILEQELTR
ncbi:DUF6090 family protein [Robiginitalea sp. SC105]|uniref:DUF6090 family protein n=1 Tax=Robiginitalea sp. SC105 TaxID=2762332 RepID=UPI00163AD4E6|nr:DUF6090 family protein [Robiginitalea sp. SC105]MBC2840075.1 hypothetical protein [Robiginitalea sp. SC105]